MIWFRGVLVLVVGLFSRVVAVNANCRGVRSRPLGTVSSFDELLTTFYGFRWCIFTFGGSLVRWRVFTVLYTLANAAEGGGGYLGGTISTSSVHMFGLALLEAVLAMSVRSFFFAA